MVICTLSEYLLISERYTYRCIVKRQTPTLNGKAEKTTIFLKLKYYYIYASEYTILLRQTRMKVYGILRACMLDRQRIYCVICWRQEKMLWYTGNIFVCVNIWNHMQRTEMCWYTNTYAMNLYRAHIGRVHAWTTMVWVSTFMFRSVWEVCHMRIAYTKMHNFKCDSNEWGSVVYCIYNYTYTINRLEICRLYQWKFVPR